jgi:hypothetical protein
MPKLNVELSFATLIPEFLHQFLSAAQVVRESITCLDFEDLRDAVKNTKEPELEGIRQFLAVENEGKDEEKGKGEIIPDTGLEKMSDELDAELEAIDDELYHRYTPGEIKYMLGEVIDNIELLYGLYKAHADLNLSLSVGFKLKSGLESGIVIEFLSINESPEFLEDVFFIPMKNYFVSDDIIARMYIVYEKEKQGKYSAEFAEIAAMLQLKQGGDAPPHVHGPDCGHVH